MRNAIQNRNFKGDFTLKRKDLRKLIIVVSLVVALAIVVPMMSGCLLGKPAVTPPEAPPVEPIKIGCPLPLTGYMASDGALFREGALMVQDEINAAGGVLGRPIEVIMYDSKELLAETFALAAEKLIFRDKVDAVLIGYSGEAGPDTFGKYDVPFIFTESSTRCVEIMAKPGFENCFMSTSRDYLYGRMSWTQVKTILPAAGYEFPNHKLVRIYGPWEWDTYITLGFAEAAEEEGWDVVLNLNCALETREWAGILTSIRAENPAIIVMEVFDPAATASFDLQFQENPINAIIVHEWTGTFPAYQEMVVATGEVNGVLSASVYGGALNTPEGIAWKQRYKDRYGKEAPLTCVGIVYDNYMIWKTAVERVGDVKDYQAICKAIEDYPYTGVCGTYAFNPEHYTDISELPLTMLQAQNGRLVILARNTVPETGTSFITPPWIK